MTKHRCFMLTPTNRAARWLRRTTGANELDVRLCEPLGYHEAMVRIEDGEIIEAEDGGISIDPMEWPDYDPRWPERCGHCDYEFTGICGGQLFYEQIFLTPDGREVIWRDPQYPLPSIACAPVGAMRHCPWLAKELKFVGPDGLSLSVMTPAGPWEIDSQYPTCGRWSRTGQPPNVTVSPSIHFVDRYHGLLREGYLCDA